MYEAADLDHVDLLFEPKSTVIQLDDQIVAEADGLRKPGAGANSYQNGPGSGSGDDKTLKNAKTKAAVPSPPAAFLQHVRVPGRPRYTRGKAGVKRFFRNKAGNRMFCRGFSSYLSAAEEFVRSSTVLLGWNSLLELVVWGALVAYVLLRSK